MKKFKSSLFLGFVIMMVVTLSGCIFGGKQVVATPESTMPQDISVVFAIDHSNLDQVALFKQIVDRVPSLGLWEEVLKELETSPSPFKYSENKDLIEGNWKILVGVKLPNDQAKIMKMMTEDKLDLGTGGIDVYVAGKFGMPDKIQILLDEIVKQKADQIEFLASEKNPTWRVKQGTGNVLIVRLNDVYFMATSAASRDEILKRIEDGTGFNKSVDPQKNLGYLFLDMKVVSGLYKSLLQIQPGSLPMEVLDTMKDILAVFSVENDGLKFISKVSFSEDKALVDKYYPDYNLSLIDKVPAKGVFLYEEMPSLGLYLEGSFKSLSAMFKGNNYQVLPIEEVAPGSIVSDSGLIPKEEIVQPIKLVSREKGYKSLPVTDKPSNSVIVDDSVVDAPVVAELPSLESILASDDLYGAILEQAGAISGLTAADLRKILDNPYAFVVSDMGGYLPTIALYLQVDKDSVENAKKLVGSTSTYVDLVIVGMNAELKKNNLDGIVKKEVKMVEGATLQKIYVDWTALPATKVKELTDQLGVDILTVKVEIYYGVLNDGVFVFALYPDFTDVYAKEVISSADYYKEMKAKVGEVYGRSVAFFRMSPVLELVDRYFQLAKKMGVISEENNSDEILSYELYTKIASAFDYLFVSQIKDANGASSSLFVRIKEVQLSPELLKKREAAEVEKKAADEAMMKMYQESLQ